MATTLKPPGPPRMPTQARSGATEQQAHRSFHVSRGSSVTAQRVVVYGPGGVGKTELCSLLGSIGIAPLFLDLDEGTHFMDVSRIAEPIATWDDLRAALHDRELIGSHKAIVIDSLTKAEELAIDWTIRNVKHEKGHFVSSIEGYGWGKGLVHVYETFLQLLGDLDALARSGVNMLGTCHDCTANVPNPAGDDWIRWEPRLQSPPSGKASIRHRVKEWCDHLLYVGYDTIVSEDGKAKGTGTRTIYPVEMPAWWAKSRLLADPVPYEKGDATIWKQLFGKEVQ